MYKQGKERNFKKNTAKFSLIGNQLYREYRLVLNNNGVVTRLTSNHCSWNNPALQEMEGKVREKYHVKNLRPVCRKIVTACIGSSKQASY